MATKDTVVYRRLHESLHNASLADKRVLAGFDGYIDSPVNPLDARGARFGSIGAFAAAIQAGGCRSMDIPVASKGNRMGGNGPLTAFSLAEKGAKVVCVGAMGVPLEDAFTPLNERALVYSLATPASCYALEFSDGKLMFGDAKPLELIDHQSVSGAVGSESYSDLVRRSDCVIFANWSALPHADNLLEGIIDILKTEAAPGDKLFYIDLADPSGRGEDAFARLFAQMREISTKRRVVLGVNIREMAIILKYLGENGLTPAAQWDEAAKRLGIAALVLHTAGVASASLPGVEAVALKSFVVRQPASITGSGDNFAAGYCAGHMLSLPVEQCLALGNLSGYLFVKNGRPAGLREIMEEAGLWGCEEEIINWSGEL